MPLDRRPQLERPVFSVSGDSDYDREIIRFRRAKGAKTLEVALHRPRPAHGLIESCAGLIPERSAHGLGPFDDPGCDAALLGGIGAVVRPA